jgi:hypothetical protein
MSSTASRDEALTVRDALMEYYGRMGAPLDGSGALASRWTPLARWSITLPNFAWRRHALPVHDLHHVLLGYPCTPGGEFEMAAWEFAAGRFRHAGATAFCLPLVGVGALVQPRRSFAAFIRGRAGRSLYSIGLTAEMLASPVEDVRRIVWPASAHAPTWRDRMAYAAWVTAALAWIALPVAVLALGAVAAWP